MRRGFSLVELMIVVALIGILAAMVLPEFKGNTAEAKEVAAKNNLHILRAAIELYAAQHGGVPPGYPNGDTSCQPSAFHFILQLTKATNRSGQVAEPGTPGYPYGPYISEMPENPYNKSKTVQMIANSESLPPEATGTFGWIYKAATTEIKIDWPGIDSKGCRYYDY